MKYWYHVENRFNMNVTWNQRMISELPDIDIIMPTYNSGKILENCLRAIQSQDYSGNILTTIIDGGSTDDTIEIAKSFGVRVFEKEGMYSVGKNGARHFGELHTKSPFIWYVDSDNFLIENTVAKRLVYPMIQNPSINISIPETSIDLNSPTFNRLLSLMEIKNVNNMKRAGTPLMDGYTLLREMHYGLTNCAMIRRTVATKAGGFDGDTRLLFRIRRLGLAKGVIDSKSHFYHNQTTSMMNYMKKWDRRIRRLGNMSRGELEEYFVEYPHTDLDHKFSIKRINRELTYGTFTSLMNFASDKDPIWLWLIPYNVLMLLYLLTHPKLSWRVYKNVL